MLEKPKMFVVVLGFVLLASVTSLLAGNNPNYIWIEGEKPVKQNFKFIVV